MARSHGLDSRCVLLELSPVSSCGCSGIVGVATSPLNPSFIGDGIGETWLSWLRLVVIGLLGLFGLLGLLGILQKLDAAGLAELGDGLVIVERVLGIFKRPKTVAGSLIFSPKDSRTVRRPNERTDLGDCSGCWSDGLLSQDRWLCAHNLVGICVISPSSSAGFGTLPSTGRRTALGGGDP